MTIGESQKYLTSLCMYEPDNSPLSDLPAGNYFYGVSGAARENTSPLRANVCSQLLLPAILRSAKNDRKTSQRQRYLQI